MGRKKLEYYGYCKNAPNVIELGKALYSQIKGNWNKSYFFNEHPLVVELACGKGEYTVGMAQRFPDKNFIGVDIKGDRIARGSKLALADNLDNVAFLRAGIQYSDEFFEANELDEIWLIHPDPQVRDRDESKRLTNPVFLEKYLKYLKKNGIFCLKTDSDFLFHYSLETIIRNPRFEVIDSTDDLYSSNMLELHYGIKTHYEEIFVAKGYSIKYILCKKLF